MKITTRKIIKALVPYGILVLRQKVIQKYQQKRRLKKRKTLSLAIHLVDHCNLNCKGCDNFSCIADEKYHSVRSLENDFRRIFELAGGKIDGINLLGGEPLLHPELIKIINIAGKYFSRTNLGLVTNGVLLLKQEDIFWETCKNNNVKVIITKYPINLPFVKIEETAKKHGTLLQYFGDTGTMLKQMYKWPLNLQGTEDKQKSFELCFKSNTCMALDDGKIYTCATIPYIKYFNKYFETNLEVSEKDYIDIYSVKNIEEIFEFLRKPMPFCRYCNIKGVVHDIKWETSKKEISEWV
ncbi:MAG: radical SAM protein [Dysgonamonadaceae bacterium]|nr:radical SAM protein [Dysgonamonadaceae bacterium]